DWLSACKLLPLHLPECVSGVTVVTHDLGTVTDSAARWYKQVPGGVPQYVLRGCHGWSLPAYGTGFYSSRFTSNHQSKSDYRLIISSVEVGDSAVYYCSTWDNTAKELVSPSLTP
uniref:Immunoglobulin V-set domain-containing protein n=1 Tax=Scleropages formosus TaxID=113540 RepID=A0A8D0CFN9_SCLFO